MKTFLSHHKFATFAVVTCIFSWSCWLPILADIQGDLFKSSGSTLVLFFLGAYGPSLCAILLSAYFDGIAGIKHLFRRRLTAFAALRWSVLILLIGPAIYAASLALFYFAGGHLGNANYGVLPWIPVILLVSILLGPLAEELGWRGYALPQFNLKQEFGRANILLGFVWALWHAPLFWAATGTAISGMPVTVWSIALFATAVLGSTYLYSWIYQRTNSSVWIAIMLHLSLNGSATISTWLFPEIAAEQKPLLYGLYVVTVWTLVGLIYVFQRRKSSSNLSKQVHAK